MTLAGVLKMDIREFHFWHRQHRRIKLVSLMQMVQSARLANAEQASYKSALSDIELQYNRLRAGLTATDIVKENWDDLRSLSGKQVKKKVKKH